jgi:hypothetical protein
MAKDYAWAEDDRRDGRQMAVPADGEEMRQWQRNREPRWPTTT